MIAGWLGGAFLHVPRRPGDLAQRPGQLLRFRRAPGPATTGVCGVNSNVPALASTRTGFGTNTSAGAGAAPSIDRGSQTVKQSQREGGRTKSQSRTPKAERALKRAA